MPGDVESIQIELAGLKAEVLNELKHVAHDVKNIVQAQSQLVTRREMDDLLGRRDDQRSALADRVQGLERNQNRAVWAIILAWVSGIGVVFKMLLGQH